MTKATLGVVCAANIACFIVLAAQTPSDIQFTLVQEETKFRDGQVATRDITVLGYDGSGRRFEGLDRTMFSGPTQVNYKETRITDAKSGLMTVYRPSSGLKSTLRVNGSVARVAPAPTCAAAGGKGLPPNGRFASVSQVAGLRVVGIRTQHDASDRTVERQALLAPELGCLVIEEEIDVKSKVASVPAAKSVRRLVSFSSSAPTLQIPADAKESALSALSESESSQAGIPSDCLGCDQNSKKHLDSIYNKSGVGAARQ